MVQLGKYRESVDRLVDAEASMPEVEALVAGFRLPEEQGAALWLYAHAQGCPPCPPPGPRALPTAAARWRPPVPD